MTRIFLGIDPGKTGAIAAIEESDLDDSYTVTVHDAPTIKEAYKTKPRKGGKSKTAYRYHCNPSQYFAYVKDLLGEYDRHKVHCYLERVWGFGGKKSYVKKDGTSHEYSESAMKSFVLGMSFGAWQCALGGLWIDYQTLTPQKWKKEIVCGKMSDKDNSRSTAIAIFPELEERLKRKKDADRAEAVLLAELCRRHYYQDQSLSELADSLPF